MKPALYRARKQAADSSVSRLLTRAVLFMLRRLDLPPAFHTAKFSWEHVLVLGVLISTPHIDSQTDPRGKPMKKRRPGLTALICFAALSALLLSYPARTFAQEPLDYEAEFKRAFEMVRANKLPEAAPILEKLNAAKPDDAVVLELLAYAISVVAAVEKDAEKRKKDLLRARSLAERAKELGHNTQLVQNIIERIPADGNMPTLSASEKRTPAQEALLEGEAAFSKGEMDRAIEHYERALKLDPKL
jgi:tetratricopeptide (TPR) repeat protein